MTETSAAKLANLSLRTAPGPGRAPRRAEASKRTKWRGGGKGREAPYAGA
jgi:hypothetical protein